MRRPPLTYPWISHVYGRNRTKQLANVEVIHHIDTHGTRYNLPSGNDRMLEGLIQRGRQQITAFMISTGVLTKDIDQYERSHFDDVPLKR